MRLLAFTHLLLGIFLFWFSYTCSTISLSSHITHKVWIELKTGWLRAEAASTDNPWRLCALATELAGRANIHAGAAATTYL